jgi:UDP-N-acetylglucosamine--dolichyl-phosphate N-acetylglucosaminephosphotransferase
MAVPVLVLFTLGLGNLFNTFAGFNGLEMGCSALISFFFSVVCFMTGNIMPFYISLGLSAILFSFLLHNKYPARIFPGNVGTLTVGGILAGVCLYYNLYGLIIPLMVLHIADLSLKAASAGFLSSSDFGRTRVGKDGILIPRRDYLSLAKVVLRARPMGERNLVLFFWAACAAVGISTVTALGVLL